MSTHYNNKLVILGNGFDLAHGYKTSYRDFLNDYLKGKVLDPNFKDDRLIKRVGTTPVNLEEIMKGKSFLEYIHELTVKDKIVSITSPFFKGIIKQTNKNWCDIEKFYFDCLLTSLPNSKPPSLTSVSYGNIEKINGDLDFIANLLEEYLIKETKPIKYSDTAFGDFFRFPSKTEAKVCILNFNYTRTLIDYLRTGENKEGIYIHGALKQPELPIIFGYGDESSLKYEEIQETDNNEFLKNVKSFKYGGNKNYQKLRMFMLDGGFDVEILGHSCGISDRVLLKQIFNHNDCKSIRINHHKGLESYNDTYINISRHFDLDKKQVMRDKVIPFEKHRTIPQLN